MSQRPLIYLGRSRLHRNRANLIQTLHTAAAFHEIGIPFRLYLPPWHRLDLAARLADMDIRTELDLRSHWLLHRRWHPRWFIALKRPELRDAAVYVRAPELSLALAAAGIVHHFEVHQVVALQEAGWLERIAANHRAGLIDRLVPISRAAAERLAAAGAVRERMHVSPSGVALEQYQALPPPAPDPAQPPRAVYVGRISRTRGLDILSALAREGHIRLTLVGEQQDVALTGANVRVLPFLPPREVPGLYADADCVLLPYQADLPHADAISPLKLFEAMAAGRPIVASDLPPIREVLADGSCGVLVPPADLGAWRDAVQRLRQDPAAARALGENARRRAADFSWRRRAENIAAAIGLR